MTQKVNSILLVCGLIKNKLKVMEIIDILYEEKAINDDEMIEICFELGIPRVVSRT